MGSGQTTKHQAGVSLVEILIAVAILALLALAATPQLIEYTEKRRLYNSLNEFQAAISLARSEAIRRNTSVRLSPVSNDQNNIWGSGWYVWIDQNSNSQFDTNGDVVLLSKSVLPPGVTASSNASNSTLEFTGSGFIRNFNPTNTTSQVIDVRICTGTTGELISISRNGLTTNLRSTCA
ncbi:MAG: GspH/FimT family protein [Burkholderiales bacterium]|uniref:GspH/FimT family protein n=1 Tax=Limnobacter sp. TaxID=2003368 RepID=UPI0039BD7DAE|nr:GspH/FimT family protein [Burkholderiales bacterium]